MLRQCAIHAAEARWLLDRVDLLPGRKVLDVGRGPLGVLDLLAEKVAATGEVIGLDREPRLLALARDILSERGLTQVRLVEADASATGLPTESFDLAHERLVLVNVPNPAQIVSEMVRLVRPGGIVAAQEVDWLSWTCEPAHPAWEQLLSANEAVWRAQGADVRIGRRLLGLLRSAGLVDVEVAAHARVWRPGDAYHTLLLQFTALHRRAILDRRLLAERELERAVRELEAHLSAPGTLVVYALLFQAWGRKPSGDAIHALPSGGRAGGPGCPAWAWQPCRGTTPAPLGLDKEPTHGDGARDIHPR